MFKKHKPLLSLLSYWFVTSHFLPLLQKRVKSSYKPSGPLGRHLCTVSVPRSDYEYFLRITGTSNINFPSTQLYTLVEQATAIVMHLAQELNTVCLARAWTQTTWFRDEHTNREATVSPFHQRWLLNGGSNIKQYNTICFKSYLYLCCRCLAYFSL